VFWSVEYSLKLCLFGMELFVFQELNWQCGRFLLMREVLLPVRWMVQERVGGAYACINLWLTGIKASKWWNCSWIPALRFRNWLSLCNHFVLALIGIEIRRLLYSYHILLRHFLILWKPKYDMGKKKDAKNQQFDNLYVPKMQRSLQIWPCWRIPVSALSNLRNRVHNHSKRTGIATAWALWV
jgi:hypothetical protein